MKLTLLEITPQLNEQIRTTLRYLIPKDLGMLIVMGVLLLVSVAAFLWAAFLRKRPRRSHHQFHSHSADPPKSDAFDRTKGRGLFFRKHHRRRHRHYRRNPTLAEAGGLPPIRSEEHPPAST